MGAFNYYYGRGNRVEESIRGFAYKNQDVTLMKNIRMAGGTNLELRFEAFNMWNWHTFQASTANLGQPGVQQRHCEPELRHVEWRCHAGAHPAAGDPVRVLELLPG